MVSGINQCPHLDSIADVADFANFRFGLGNTDDETNGKE
jgi:hypothetical protein